MKKLTNPQQHIIDEIAAGTYYPLCLDTPSRRVLIERGLITDNHAYPRVIALTAEGQKRVTKPVVEAQPI